MDRSWSLWLTKVQLRLPGSFSKRSRGLRAGTNSKTKQGAFSRDNWGFQGCRLETRGLVEVEDTLRHVYQYHYIIHYWNNVELLLKKDQAHEAELEREITRG